MAGTIRIAVEHRRGTELQLLDIARTRPAAIALPQLGECLGIGEIRRRRFFLDHFDVLPPTLDGFPVPDASLSRFIGLARLLAELGNARRQLEPKRLAKHRTARGGMHRSADFACGFAVYPADLELIEALIGPPDVSHRDLPG